MKRLFTIALAVLLFASCSQSQNQSQSINQSAKKVDMEKLEKGKIEHLLKEYQKSLNKADAKFVQSLYLNDGIFMPSGAPSAVGAEEILKSYEYLFSQVKLNIEFFIDEILVEEDFAYATTGSQGTAIIQATGNKVTEENRELFVFEKVEGEWKIARYMFNKTK